MSLNPPPLESLVMDEEFIKAAKIVNAKMNQLSTMTDEEQNLVLNSVLENRHKPRGWKPTTVAPYYKPKYALEMKIVLDKMFEDQHSDLMLLFKDFTCSPNTLYNRVNHAWKYLVDKLDTGGKYKFMQDNTRVKREPTGIRIAWVHNIGPKEPGEIKELPTVAISSDSPVQELPASSLNWKKELIQFIEDAEDDEALKLTGLLLNQDQFQEVKLLLSQCPDIHVIKLSHQEIKIFKGKLPTE